MKHVREGFVTKNPAGKTRIALKDVGPEKMIEIEGLMMARREVIGAQQMTSLERTMMHPNTKTMSLITARGKEMMIDPEAIKRGMIAQERTSLDGQDQETGMIAAIALPGAEIAIEMLTKIAIEKGFLPQLKLVEMSHSLASSSET